MGSKMRIEADELVRLHAPNARTSTLHDQRNLAELERPLIKHGLTESVSADPAQAPHLADGMAR